MFAFFLVTFVASVAMWVRSYFRFDQIVRSSHGIATVLSTGDGQVALERVAIETTGVGDEAIVRRAFEMDAMRPYLRTALSDFNFVLGFGAKFDDAATIILPYWFITLASLGFAFAAKHKPRWQLSLTEILGVVTLTAFAAGLVAWVSRLGR